MSNQSYTLPAELQVIRRRILRERAKTEEARRARAEQAGPMLVRDTWVTVPYLAAQLGQSRSTIYRGIKDGRFTVERDESEYNAPYYVRVDHHVTDFIKERCINVKVT